MAHADGGHAEVVDDLAQERGDLRLGGHVEAGRRLVEDHRLRIAAQGQGERDPLLLPAGELVRIALEGVGGQTHPGQPLAWLARPMARRPRPRWRRNTRRKWVATVGPG